MSGRKRKHGMAASAVVGYALVSGRVAEAVDMGSPWLPPSASQRFPTSIWLNEVHLTGNDAARTIEIAAITAAGINYSNIDAVLVDLDGNRVATKNLGPAGGCTVNRNVGTGPSLDFITCSNWQAPGTLLLGGGLALVNNRGTATAADDLAIQFVFTSRGATDQAPIFLGLAASAFPVDQWVHALTPEGFSIQLVNAGVYDAALKAVDPYSFNWQGMLPATFGAVNTGTSPQWGDFAQTFVAGTLPVVWPTTEGNPATAPPLGDGTGGGGDGGTAGGGNGTFPDVDPSQCFLGRLTEWSACSVPCVSSASTPSQSVGWQIRYEPILFSTTGPAVDVSKCPTLTARSDRRSCAARSVRSDDVTAPADTCSQCNDGARNGQESDIDCGGGMTDAVGNWTLMDATAWVQARYDPVGGYELSGKVTSDGGISGAGDSPLCRRCGIGRTCGVHADCNAQAGLVCLQSTCQPWWFVNATSFADATIFIQGASVRDFFPSSSSSDAIATLQRTVAEAAAFDRATGVASFVPTYNVSATSWLSSVSSTVNDGLLEPRWALQTRRQRALANQADSLTISLRIGATTEAGASAIVANLQANAQLLSYMLQERLRVYSPVIAGVTLSGAATSNNPYNFTQPEQKAKDIPISSGLAGGAIAGIVLGVIAALALAAFAAVAIQKYVNREKPLPPPPPVRRTMNIGETTPVEANGNLVDRTPHHHQKARFAPHAADNEAAAAVGATATATAAGVGAGASSGEPLSAKRSKVDAGGSRGTAPVVTRNIIPSAVASAETTASSRAPPVSGTSAASGVVASP